MPEQLPDPTPAAEQAPAKPETYTDRRCRLAGIPDDICKFRAPHPRSPDQHQRNTWYVFGSDDEDNLVITYETLGGEVLTYDNGTKNNPDSLFERKRLKEPRIYTDREGNEQTQKYTQPKGTRQYPFFMPGLVAKYQAGTKIPTLYLVEGELKAAAGVARGLDVVGMPSNQVPRELVGGHWHLESQLVALIKKCEVETLVLLHDADALTVKWEPGKDLGKRPSSFAQAVINFREAIQPLLDPDASHLKRAFYMHGKRELCRKDAKGLDDLFIAFADEQQAIVDDLLKGTEASRFFQARNVTTPHYDAVRGHFGVNRKGLSPEDDFYKLYKEDIGIREFVFAGRRFVPDGDEVKYVAHQDAELFARVGADWFRWVRQLKAGGELVEQLEVWKVGEIQRDYKKYPNFLDECPKFTGFTVEPSWNGEYQRNIAGNLNLVTPLAHQLKSGPFDNTLDFLKHLFGGTGTASQDVTGDPFTVALDWLTIAHNHPKHQLPVVILVSKEYKTGKTTFLNWLNWIYGSNATILNNAQFAMKFNAHYATKFVIGLDEAFQDLDKKAEKERLKQMVTGKEMYVERKGIDLKPVPFYAKIVMTSNDDDKIMKLEDGENRWFVVKVPPLPTEDVDMEAKLRAEIPAWLHFLHHREPHHPRKSRLWFEPEHFITEQFRIIVEATKNRLDHNIEEFVKDMFLMYRLGKLRVSVKWLTKSINETSKYRVDEKDVRDYLKQKRKLEPSPAPQRIKIPVAVDDALLNAQGHPEVTGYYEETARFYTLLVQDWLSGKELAVFEGPWGNKSDEPEPAAVPVATAPPGRPEVPGVRFGAAAHQK
ncbi:MAG: primase-helicase family protein [Janthinobacterium lividum]